MDKKGEIRANITGKWFEWVNGVIEGSTQLEHYRDRKVIGPTQMNWRTDAYFWLKRKLGYLFPPGWEEGETVCPSCKTTQFTLHCIAHLSWQCDAIDYGEARGWIHESCRKFEFLAPALTDLVEATKWWLSVQQSYWNRKEIGTYIRKVHKMGLAAQI